MTSERVIVGTEAKLGLWQRHWGLGAILGLFLCLGVVYSVATPVLEAPDELQHHRFLEHVVLSGQLPVQTGRDPSNLSSQEASQPPLYYLLAGAVSFWAFDGTAEIRLNPHSEVGRPMAMEALDNKNLVLHSSDEQFPYRGLALAVHLARWLSLLLGAITVACTYVLGLSLTGSRTLAAGSAAACAFLPMFVFMSASANNDSLAVALCSLALVLLVRALQGHHGVRDFAVLGVVLGLGALSKLSALGLFGPLGIVCLALAWRERNHWLYLGRGLLAAAIAGLIAGWWYWRNLALYGEVLGIEAMVRTVGRRRPTPSLWDLAGEMGKLKDSYWGVFGWNNIPMQPWTYWVYDALAALALLGLVVSLARAATRRQVSQLAAWGLLVLWPLLVLLGLLRWTQTTYATYGRLLFPAIACLSVLFFLGLAALVPRRGHQALAWLLAIGLFSLAAAAPFQSIIPAYRGWPYQARAMAERFSNGIELVALDVGAGWRLQPAEGVGMIIEPDSPAPPPLSLTLYWRATQTPTVSYTASLQLIDSSGQSADQHDSPPKNGTRLTTTWLPQEIVADPRRLQKVSALPSGKYVLVLILYERESMARLPLANGQDYLTLGEVRR